MYSGGEGGRKRHRLTAKSRDELIGKFVSLARKMKTESIRELTEGQLTEVARTAQRDRVQAINLYLGYAFPENFAEENDAAEIVNNPRYANFLSSVTEFVWRNSRLDSTDSEDWQDFKTQFVGDRPIPQRAAGFCLVGILCSRRNARLIFAEQPRDKGTACRRALPTASDLEKFIR